RRAMREPRLLEGALAEVRTLEYDVDSFENAGQRAEAEMKRHMRHFEMRGLGAEGILPAGIDEDLRVGTLEREDRLLLVAHREETARAIRGALAEEEVVDQRADDF